MQKLCKLVHCFQGPFCKTVIWQICSNRPGKKCPRVPVWVRGVQSLFGRGDANFGGASLTTKAKQVHPSKELSSHEKEPSRMGQLAHIIPEPQGHSLSSQAPGGPPPCMNDCIAQPTPGPLAPMGLHGPPVPGNSVESKQARRGASTSGGHFCIWARFRRQVECGDGAVSGRESHAHNLHLQWWHTLPYAHFPICILASAASPHSFVSVQEQRLLETVAVDGENMQPGEAEWFGLLVLRC